MRLKLGVITGLAATILGGVLYTAAQEQPKAPHAVSTSSGASDVAVSTAVSHPKPLHEVASDAHFEGEKRFRANCGRCHMAPHKLPPRMMVTIERHMRVRATITDEDMRLIVAYMTE